MSKSDRVHSQQETRLPLVDILEILGLIVVPALLFGLGVVILDGPNEFVTGTIVGGVFGVLLARLRGSLAAVRTDDGIKWRLRSAPDETVWTRLTAIEYDGKYDRLLAVVCLLVGVGAFAAIPVAGASGSWAVRLVAISLGGFVCALLTLGARSYESGCRCRD